MDTQKFNRLLRKISTDSRAFEEIYTEYYSKVKLHILRVFGKLVSAEDVAQEVFLSLLSLNLKENIEFPTTWLMRLSENKAKDILRARHEEFELSEITPAPFRIDSTILRADLNAVIHKLDPASQKIIYLHIWEGYTYKEIANDMEISCNNVRVKASRAYKILGKLL